MLAVKLILVCAAFTVTLAASSVTAPRQASVLGSLFQWFQETFEMIFNYFAAPKSGRPGGGGSSGRGRVRMSYKNYQLLRVRPVSNEAVADVEALEDEEGLEFWRQPMRNRSSDVLVPPEHVQYVKEYLAERDIEFTVLSLNLEADIRKQNPKLSKHQKAELKSANGHSMTWNRYHRYEDILGYMDYLASYAPHLVQLISIGKSNEGRTLKVIKIASGNDSSKPAIWIDGGMHGREWIAPAVALYILKLLVEKYESNKSLLQRLDWYIMPVVNPDGYEYTHTNDRFWRKNRSKPPKNSEEDSSTEKGRFLWGLLGSCRGVDLNRNFDFHWGEVGSSDSSCSPTYAGARPFSEPETRALSNFILEHRDAIGAFITLHSYSQMWLVPWGYTNKKSSDYDDLVYMGRKAIEALSRVHGTKYSIGTSPALLYPTSGSSDDWAKGRAGIKYSYTVELRDRGTFGFLLPASQIVPTGRETFAGIRTVAKAIINNKSE